MSLEIWPILKFRLKKTLRHIKCSRDLQKTGIRQKLRTVCFLYAKHERRSLVLMGYDVTIWVVEERSYISTAQTRSSSDLLHHTVEFQHTRGTRCYSNDIFSSAPSRCVLI
ncbi:hypothetical protein L798_10977 [Zootermopsis nevadensis]|uniref:Uncharacterized protein n=1 Tax=Zootermopsis nevadensis TaxID=136037 RepID=A0A067R6Y9_ZOONE|nr:hypothetical protein L798_10977 [Zootermopsis nevadensis]